MDIVPVVDLKGGRVVRARMGRRRDYQPIHTPLSRTSDPLDVVRGLLSVHPFRSLYIADLDAIEGSGGNSTVLLELRHAFAPMTLWVDNGIADAAHAADWLSSGLGRLVLGSETQADARLVSSLRDDERVMLSLDFRGGDFLGPRALLDDAHLWPHQVIVMTLARVGSGAGPDLARLAKIGAVASGRSIYAAGGVRNAADLAALERSGVAGVLVASSLHDGHLTGLDIARFETLVTS